MASNTKASGGGNAGRRSVTKSATPVASVKKAMTPVASVTKAMTPVRPMVKRGSR